MCVSRFLPLNQALGTAVASELDLAYWHARYTAASRFDAGCVTADPALSFHVVPPPEVYFVGLAFQVPTVAELRALPLSPDLRRTLGQVFDLPVVGQASSGVCAHGSVCVSYVWGRVAVESVGAGRAVASRLLQDMFWSKRCKGDVARADSRLFVAAIAAGDNLVSG